MICKRCHKTTDAKRHGKLCHTCAMQDKHNYYERHRTKMKKYMRDRYRTNKTQILAQQRERYYSDSEMRERHKASAIRSKWAKKGFSDLDYPRVYAELLVKQKGLCAVCGCGEKLVLDHSHATGKIRGLLCQRCNRGLGLFRDSPEVLLKAYQFLISAQ